MSFGQAVSTCFKKYAVFAGRASRSEFWYWVLFYIIVAVIVNILDSLFGWQVYSAENLETGNSVSYAYNTGWLSAIWYLVALLPMISVSVRRLHDTGRSGWWWWLNIICCIGGLILLIFYIQPSQPEENQYGPPEGMAPVV